MALYHLSVKIPSELFARLETRRKELGLQFRSVMVQRAIEDYLDTGPSIADQARKGSLDVKAAYEVWKEEERVQPVAGSSEPEVGPGREVIMQDLTEESFEELAIKVQEAAGAGVKIALHPTTVTFPILPRTVTGEPIHPRTGPMFKSPKPARKK